jgi:polysaccharide pyruvyl transferase CsaB
VKRVLISGWYGNGNLGDEALLAGMLRAIAAADPAIEPVVFSDDPPRTAREHRVRTRSRDNRSHRRRLASEARALPRYDALAIGGGGLIKDFGDRPGNVHAWLRPGIVASLMRRPASWYAIGVDEIRHEESRAVVRRAAARTRLITVRDAGSARALAALDVEQEPVVTADPAVLTVAPDQGWRAGERPLVTVCPRRWKSTGAGVDRPDLEERVLSELADALDALVERHDARIRFVPFRSVAGDDDAEVCAALARLMTRSEEASVVPLPGSPEAAGELIARSQLVVGTRLHSLILAAAAAVPSFGLEYMPKIRFFAERVGAGRRTAGLEQAAAPGHLTRELDAALEERGAERARLEPVSGLLSRLGRLDGKLLSALLRDPERLPALRAEAKELNALLLGATARARSPLESAPA